MHIYAISDLHTDFAENWQYVQSLPPRPQDTLIVAGDIASRLEIIYETLATLRTKFKHLFFLPGNHDLWASSHETNSLEKLFRILDLCDQLDIKTRPTQLHHLWIVPLFSWYHPDFAPGERDEKNELEGWVDFYLCRWPPTAGTIHDYFFKMNETHLKPYDGPIISFSHFIPRRDLLPPQNMLRFKALPLVAGSPVLEQQIRLLKPHVHVFGHSHINYDKVIDGIRYVQNALLYPRDRHIFGFGLKPIWHIEE